MVKKSKGLTKTGQEMASNEESRTAKPKCLKIAENGIGTGKEFAQFMSAMMSDLVGGRITPGVGNAACNAGGKLLKVVEMQHRYGTTQGGNDTGLKLT